MSEVAVVKPVASSLATHLIKTDCKALVGTLLSPIRSTSSASRSLKCGSPLGFLVMSHDAATLCELPPTWSDVSSRRCLSRRASTFARARVTIRRVQWARPSVKSSQHLRALPQRRSVLPPLASLDSLANGLSQYVSVALLSLVFMIHCPLQYARNLSTPQHARFPASGPRYARDRVRCHGATKWTPQLLQSCVLLHSEPKTEWASAKEGRVTRRRQTNESQVFKRA